MENQDIVCIANTTWHGEYTKSTVQIMSLLAQKNNVVFVEYPFTIKDIITTLLGKQKAPVLKMLGIKKRLTSIKTRTESSVYQLVVPPVLPVSFLKSDKIFNYFFNCNATIYKKQLKKSLSALGISSPIVITAYNPFYGLSLVGTLNEKLNVYYCYDGADTRRHGNRIFEVDENLSKSVDGVITTSDFLKDEKKEMNPKTFVVKNGVEFEMFHKFAKKDILKKNKRKKIGYIGSLDYRFDIDTVEHAIQKLHNFDFEFTGSLRNPAIENRLAKYKNVLFRKAVEPNQVPRLLAQYDAGIIPYLVNEINRNIYPLKINEYFAVGVPIVMTPFANLKDFEGMVSVSINKENFASKIEWVINNDSQQLIAERINFAKTNSWVNRFKDFEKILDKLLQNVQLKK